MSTINVFPANQGFPRPPDGGVVSTSPSKDVKVIPQAFAPAPLVNPFPIPPTPPPTPFLPATQGVPPVAVLAEVIPFNPLSVDVDLMKVDSTAGDAPTYTISDAGSFAIVPGPAVRFYTIISVIDLDTGAAPTTSSVNLKITMSGGSAPPLGLPLDSYGFTFAGRSLLFAAGAWIPAQTTPERIIAVNGDLLNGDSIVIVPNLDPDGNSFPWPSGPAAGTIVAVDTARNGSEVVFQQTGQVQNVIPSSIPHFPSEQILGPLIPEPGDIESDLPVQEIVVSDQETVVGTPVDYFPTNHHP